MGRKGRYQPGTIAKVEMLVLECGLLNKRGEIAWSRIARYLGVTVEAIRHWRDPIHDNYHADFARAVKELEAEVDTGKTKRDCVTQSHRHKLTKRIRELRKLGPEPPPADYTKPLLLRYSAEVLGLTLSRRLRVKEIKREIDRAIKDQTVEKMVTVTEIIQEVDPHPEARKAVLRNMGSEKWNMKDQLESSGVTSIEITVNEVTEDPSAGKRIDEPDA